MEGWGGIERRRWPRRPVSIDCVIFEIDGQKLPFRFDQEIIRDISIGGACVELTRALLTQSNISMEFGLCSDPPFVKVTGTIVWERTRDKETNTIPQYYKYRVGVCFLDVSEEDGGRIKKFVERRLE